MNTPSERRSHSLNRMPLHPMHARLQVNVIRQTHILPNPESYPLIVMKMYTKSSLLWLGLCCIAIPPRSCTSEGQSVYEKDIKTALLSTT